MGLPDSSSGQENLFLWNLSTKWIGAIKTSVYIYVSPVVTVVLSVVILHEKMTFVSVPDPGFFVAYRVAYRYV